MRESTSIYVIAITALAHARKAVCEWFFIYNSHTLSVRCFYTILYYTRVWDDYILLWMAYGQVRIARIRFYM